MSEAITHQERTAAVGNQAREGALSTFGRILILEEHALVYRRAVSKHRLSNLARSYRVFQKLAGR